MTLVELVVTFILGLQPSWRADYCETVDMREDLCRAKQEQGYATAQLLAPIFVAEAERAELGPYGAFWLASVAQKENSLSIGDQCILTVTRSRLASEEELEDSPAGERRMLLCVNLPSGRQSCRRALVLEETEETLKVNYCMAGEVGTFQLTRYEAAAGTIVPATGQALPRSYRERRELLMDPTVNTSLAAAALARLQDHCCGDDQECRADWSWVGCYNTGSCTSGTSHAYANRIQAYFKRGMDYLCQEAPEYEGCPKPEEEDAEEGAEVPSED